ncbi:MAG: YraN family protein [Deltaproteobacteria bacterium]|nr:MAG: YraN family protein [Deltaproteobacteria bacterium]
MGDNRKALGDRGEDLAVRYLLKRGYKVIEKNYRCFLGEIDLIARDKGTLVFVEIKARSSARFGLPQEAVSPFKQRKLIQVAKAYMAERHLGEAIATRFDVVAVQLTPSGPEIELIKDAFQMG